MSFISISVGSCLRELIPGQACNHYIFPGRHGRWPCVWIPC